MSESVPARGRRHPMSVVTQARRYRIAGWRPFEIVGLFADDGISVSFKSVCRWTDPAVEEAERRRQEAQNRRRAARRSGRIRYAREPTPEFKFVRMRALRDEAELSCNAVAKVLAFDFGDPITEDQVRYALAVGRYPRELSKAPVAA